MKRKQAAVVFNDIQGYTTLMQENESHAVAIRQRHKEVVDRLTREFKGTIIQYYGDGTLSIFDSAVDAVQCALSMQREFHQAPKIPLRIGINSGDVLLGPDGVYGDSVNIASRIERMSVPGSVLVSDRVREELRRQCDIETLELGQFELKNVRRPISIYAVVSDGIKVPEPLDLAGKIGFKEKSLLVLPFSNLTKDPDNDAFSDEITDQVIAALSQIEGLRVTSRTSSFSFKDKSVNLRQLHQELGMDHVLEGSVRKQGNRVRITAQLINAAHDFQLWSETYHREISDTFRVQDEISVMISNKLKASFLQKTRDLDLPAEDDRSTEPEVYAHYHKGRYHLKQMQPGYLDQAMLHFKKALDDDPLFYPAWPSLALAILGKAFANQMFPEEAAKYTLHCLESMDKLHADHPHTHLIRAIYHFFFTRQWNEVCDHLQSTIGHPLNDHFIFSSMNLQVAGLYELSAGWTDKAIATFRKALKADPLNISIRLELARAYMYKRDFKKALDTIDQLLRHASTYIPAIELKGWILFNMGRQREGTETFELITQQAILPVAGMAGLAYAYARTSQQELATATRDKLWTLYQDLPSHLPHYDMAIAHLGAQEYQAMFEDLDQAWKSGMPCLLFIETDPLWEEIRRFKPYKALRDQVLDTNQRPPL